MARVFGLAILLCGAPLAAQQLDYSYQYPPRAAAFAPLKGWLDADARASRAKFDRGVALERASAKRDGYVFNGFGATREWRIVAETPRFLSLSMNGWDYSGGAHGNPFNDALLYDKQAGRRMTPLALFTSPAALSRTLRRDFCRLLDAERARRRGQPVDRKAMFGDCIDPVKQVVILGSRGRRTFDRIGVLVAPYEAGSYAEGTYDVTLPVTPAIIAQVRPEYRAAFAVAR